MSKSLVQKNLLHFCRLIWILLCISFASGHQPIVADLHQKFLHETWMPIESLDPDLAAFYNIWKGFFDPMTFYNTLADQSLEADPDSGHCFAIIKALLKAENISKPEWAFRMLDATGKPGSAGLFDGNLHALGNYEECLDISGQLTDSTLGAVDFIGRFVLTTLVFTTKVSNQMNVRQIPINDWTLRKHNDYHVDWSALNITSNLTQDFLMGIILSSPRWGICLPSECSRQLVESTIDEIWKNAALLTGNKTIPFRLYVTSSYTSEDNTSLLGGEIAAIVALSVIGLTVFVGTILDVKQLFRQNLAVDLIKCFSLHSNVKKLFSVQHSPDNIGCIHGIRFLSMAWVVLGHSFYLGLYVPWSNMFDVSDIYDTWGIMIILGSPFSVDTFFFLSGFLMAHQLLKALDKTKGKFNPLLMYLHRYIRLTPAYGLIMLVFSTLAVKVGSGPLWNFVENQRSNCESYWWANLLYVNNFVGVNKLCMGESWYLACDFQLFIIGPFLVWPMWKWKRFGIVLGLFYLTVSTLIPGILTYVNDWPMAPTTTIHNDEWMEKFYIKTYTRSSTYIWGIFFGFLWSRSYLTNKGRPLPKWVLAGGWLISASFCLVAMLGLKSKWPVNVSCLTERCYDRSVAALYAALVRLTWAIGLSWVLFACMTRHGGVINSFLSWSAWVPLSRLTFCIYLIHIHVMYTFHMSAKGVTFFSPYLLVYYFLGHLAVSVVVGMFVCLLFETPLIGIEKILFKAGRKKEEVQPEKLEPPVKDADSSEAMEKPSSA